MKDLEIIAFAEQMQEELDANKHKGDWRKWVKSTDFDSIISELEYHKAKLLMIMKEGDKKLVKEHIADCANILMFIGVKIDLYIKYEEEGISLNGLS